MKCYQEITLIPQTEMSLYFIWSKLYTQLHLAFVEMQDNESQIPVGVSFPQYHYQKGKHFALGNKLRLFAEDKMILEKLNVTKWLMRLADYVHCTGIRDVPVKISGYAIYKRYHPGKNNVESLAKRYSKRHDLSMEEALKHYAEFHDDHTQLPFVRLKSLTNQQVFNLFIDKKSVSKLMNEGFNSYGLGSASSVPEF